MEYEQTYARQINILNEVIGSLNDYYSFLANDLMGSYGLCSVWKDNVVGGLVSKITNYTHDLYSLNNSFYRQAERVINYYANKGSSRRYCQDVRSRRCYFSSSYSNAIYVDTDRVKGFAEKLKGQCDRMAAAYYNFKNATSVNYDPEFSNIFLVHSDLRQEFYGFIQNQIYLYRVILRCMELYECADNGITTRNYSIKAIRALSNYLKQKGYRGEEDIRDLNNIITQYYNNPEKMSKKDYIKVYEFLHEDEAQSINNFFRNNNAPNEDISQEDIDNIKYLAYKSEDPAHKIFFDNLDDCNVNSWNYEKTAFYGKGDGDRESGIHVKISECRKDNYRTFFHEYGHYIDDRLFIYTAVGQKYSDGTDIPVEINATGSISASSVIHTNPETSIYTALYEDLRSYLTSVVVNVNPALGAIKLNDESVNKVIEALLDGRKKDGLNPYEKMVYDAFQDGIEKQPILRSNAISDIVGGLTNNTTAGYDTDGELFPAKVGIGHARINDDGKPYWYDDKGESTGLQEKEFIAHYMSYAMNGDKERLEELRTIFPNATMMVEKLLVTGSIQYSSEADGQKVDEWIKEITTIDS